MEVRSVTAQPQRYENHQQQKAPKRILIPAESGFRRRGLGFCGGHGVSHGNANSVAADRPYERFAVQPPAVRVANAIL
jgi:hypothetical protein